MGSIKGSETLEIQAPAEKIISALADVEAFPSWLPAYKKVTVLERDANNRPKRVAFEAERFVVIKYTLEYNWEPTGMSWNKVAGDGIENNGSYVLESNGAATKVTINYSINPGAPVPDFIIRPGVKKGVLEDFKALKKKLDS